MTDHRSYICNLSSGEKKAWKKFRPEQDSNPWPLWYRCSALNTNWAIKPTGSWSLCEFVIYPLRWRHESEYMNFFFIYSLSCLHLSGYITNSHNDQLPVGLIAQWIEHCTGIAEVMDSNPVQAWIFFRLSFCNCHLFIYLILTRIRNILISMFSTSNLQLATRNLQLATCNCNS